MAQDRPFHELIRRVRGGDEQAATDLVRLYEPAVRRAVRYRLADTRLGRALDSLDICQSVLGSFFIRAALGQYDLETPEQLIKLLTTMARNKLAGQVERERAGVRDQRRVAECDTAEWATLTGGATPSRVATARELLDEARRRLTADERQLLEMREEGHAWAEIARRRGASAEALRKTLSRAVSRVADELGWDG
jgi:RNA polymerase sigma factor (sigma-70 family)